MQMPARDLVPGDGYLSITREFFAPRAATWDERFQDDDAAYVDAIHALGPKRAGVVVDLGCGTGRALPHLRHSVGAGGVVVGIDATPEMLIAAARQGRDADAHLVLADVMRLPILPHSVDAFFAAGLLSHVPDPARLLASLARAATPACRMALFHPVGRSALARRHNRVLRPDEVLDPRILPGLLARTNWETEFMDDSENRYLALARIAD